MSEITQQTIYLAVNITIFIIALTISINLMIGVRDVAELSAQYDASIPTGSRVVSVDTERTRAIKGYELKSYYSRYMSEQALLTTSHKFEIIIENKDGSKKITKDTTFDKSNLEVFFENNGIKLLNDYEVITTKYNSIENVLTIKLKEI